MLPLIQTTDAFWKCLYPSFRRPLLRPLAGIIAQKESKARFLASAPPRNPRCRTRLVLQLYQPSRDLYLKTSTRPPTPGEYQKYGALENASNTELHDELDKRAQNGDIEWVRCLLRILVRGRGERLDGRHYTAMILANVHAEIGSASEVEVLLKEMVGEGIALTSGAYHAVLKVHTDAPRSRARR